MHEIKVKAWDTNRKKMHSAEEMGLEQLTLSPDGKGFINVHSADTKFSLYYPHLIPLLFTNLGHNEEWYEKDILIHKPPAGRSEHSAPYGNEPKSWKDEKIVILRDCGGFVGVHISAYLKYQDQASHIIHNDWEVIKPYRLWNLQGWYTKIGNVYENPKLLEPK